MTVLQSLAKFDDVTRNLILYGFKNSVGKFPTKTNKNVAN